MTAVIGLTFQVRVATQKGDKVAITGSHPSLGSWKADRILYLKPQYTHNSNVWTVTVNMPVPVVDVHYRYLVCRKLPSYQQEEESYIIRHWEAGVMPRYKLLREFDCQSTVDVYGEFDCNHKMFVDQGWLLGETEIQLRFYKNPIHMFRKHLRRSSYKVKCTAVNLSHLDLSTPDIADDYFETTIHSSNPLIRVSCFGKYSNMEQSGCGMSIHEKDYVVFQLRTNEPDIHGIKIDFFGDDPGCEEHIGYANILPVHLNQDNGKEVFVIADKRGFPIGHVTVRYSAIKPCFGLDCDLAASYTLYWRERAALDIGHRGVGDTHTANFDSEYKHENTIGALQKAVDSGADFVEIDVHLSQDKVPVIWHDFNVGILLRKKQKGSHNVHTIPVKDLTFSQLQALRVDYATRKLEEDPTDDALHDIESSDILAPFPSLKQALEKVDEHLGFFIELKYPQELFVGGMEEGIKTYFKRNEFIDTILKVIFEAAGSRRVILASFDPDICVMARLKQNKYPVIAMVWDLGSADPYWHDMRTHHVKSAIALAKSSNLLGLMVNSGCLVGDRQPEGLLEKVLADNMIALVYGSENNDGKTRDELKSRGVHGVCYDDIVEKSGVNVFRAEQDEKRRLLSDTSVSLGQSLSSLVEDPPTPPSSCVETPTTDSISTHNMSSISLKPQATDSRVHTPTHTLPTISLSSPEIYSLHDLLHSNKPNGCRSAHRSKSANKDDSVHPKRPANNIKKSSLASEDFY